MVTANTVLDMVNANWNLVSKVYQHINQFNLSEIQDFLDSKLGQEISSGYNRSHQVRQAICVIGAAGVDTKTADVDTEAVYKAVWAITKECKCTYCNKSYSYKLMFGNSGGVCSKSRCQLNYMRDSL